MVSRPFVVEGGAMRRALDRREPLSLSGPTDELRVIDTRVEAGTLAHAEVTLEPTGSAVTVRGTIGCDWTAPCRRCAEPIGGRVEAEILEIFETEPTEGETWPLGTDRVELAELVRETILLELPPAPEPPAATDGSCSLCGLPAPSDPAPPDSSRRDPRWAALDGLELDEG